MVDKTSYSHQYISQHHLNVQLVVQSISLKMKFIIIQAYISIIDALSNTIRETSELETLAQTI